MANSIANVVPMYANAISVRWSDDEVVLGFTYTENGGDVIMVSKVALPWDLVDQMVGALTRVVAGPAEGEEVH